MFQRMRGAVTVNVSGVNLTTVSDIEVKLIQESTGVDMLFTGDQVAVGNDTALMVVIPKETAMELDVSPLRGQVMFTKPDGFPDATRPFKVSVSELIKEDGYGS